jgi:hypothetical protein
MLLPGPGHGKQEFTKIVRSAGHVPGKPSGPGSAHLYDLIESGAGC